jgi:hypothetical protein
MSHVVIAPDKSISLGSQCGDLRGLSPVHGRIDARSAIGGSRVARRCPGSRVSASQLVRRPSVVGAWDT